MGGVGMGPSTSHPVPPPPGVALPIALGQAVPLPQNTINVPGKFSFIVVYLFFFFFTLYFLIKWFAISPILLWPTVREEVAQGFFFAAHEPLMYFQWLSEKRASE
jgi:hypothetical protein